VAGGHAPQPLPSLLNYSNADVSAAAVSSCFMMTMKEQNKQLML
jgi:hypothetical protein